MPPITYIGKFDAVEVDGLGVVENGVTVDAPAELAKSLLEQADNWAAAKAPKVEKD